MASAVHDRSVVKPASSSSGQASTGPILNRRKELARRRLRTLEGEQVLCGRSTLDRVSQSQFFSPPERAAWLGEGRVKVSSDMHAAPAMRATTATQAQHSTAAVENKQACEQWEQQRKTHQRLACPQHYRHASLVLRSRIRGLAGVLRLLWLHRAPLCRASR